jgi:hypothetical protein
LDLITAEPPDAATERPRYLISQMTGARPHPSKTTATVHDYHDKLTLVLASSLRKRAPGYTKMGFPDPKTLVR